MNNYSYVSKKEDTYMEKHHEEMCDYIHVHKDIVDKVNESMPEEEVLFDLAEFFKVFADSTRIKILYVLFEAPMCVCHIAKILGMTTSAISHQLKVLKNSKLVSFKKQGKTVIYSLADDHVKKIIDNGLEHVEE